MQTIWGGRVFLGDEDVFPSIDAIGYKFEIIPVDQYEKNTDGYLMISSGFDRLTIELPFASNDEQVNSLQVLHQMKEVIDNAITDLSRAIYRVETWKNDT